MTFLGWSKCSGQAAMGTIDRVGGIKMEMRGRLRMKRELNYGCSFHREEEKKKMERV